MSEKIKLNSAEEELKAKETEETAEAMAERLQKDVDEYKAKVDTINSQEELDTLEKEVIAEMNKFDKHIQAVRYQLPEGTDFEGDHIKRSDVASKIIYFVGKQEQTWQYVLGLYELCKLWKTSTVTELTYGALDSTLRLLDQVKFKGMTEWRDILIINEFMKPLHEAYAKDTTMQIYLAQKHNAIISRRDLIDPVRANTNKKED